MSTAVSTAPSEEGKKQAFLALIKDVERELISFVHRRVGSRHHAENIVQDTYMRAWRHAAFDPARADARACLFTIATNLIRDWLGCSGSKVMSLDGMGAAADRSASKDSLAPLLIDRSVNDPLGTMIARESTSALHSALSGLSAEHRDALERFYLSQEGTQFDIASRLGLTVAAFNSRLNRARIELKRLLAKPLAPGSEG